MRERHAFQLPAPAASSLGYANIWGKRNYAHLARVRPFHGYRIITVKCRGGCLHGVRMMKFLLVRGIRDVFCLWLGQGAPS